MMERRNSWFLFSLGSHVAETARDCRLGAESRVKLVSGKETMASHNCKTMFSIVILFCMFAVTYAAESQLKMVNVVYRHGDRSPLVIFPTDPNKDKWQQGAGWLTTVGMKQQYELGQFLRAEYENLLNQTYKNTEILVASSNINRSLMSAYCNLAGLYPPQGEQVWNNDLLWQPIPVHTRPEEEDHVLAIDEPCPRYDQLYDEKLRSPIVQEEEKTNRDFYDYIEAKTGVKTENITNVWEVADALFCEKTHNYSLPEWAEEKWGGITVYDKLMKVDDFSFNLLFNGTVLSRLKGGPLLKVFISNMLRVTRQKSYYKMYMYSAHDFTVAAVSDAMNVYGGVQPSYAAALLVELHEVDSGHCVKIRYRNQTDVPPVTLVNPDCQKECCPLEEFVAVTKSRVPDDWEAECGNKASSSLDLDSRVVAVVLLGLNCALVLTLVVVILVACRLASRKREYTSLP